MHAGKWKKTSEGTILEETTLIHGDHLATEVLTALFVEGGVEDAGHRHSGFG